MTAKRPSQVDDRLLLQKIDGDRMGLLEYEPPTKEAGYRFRPGWWLSARCWVDDDGRHIWFAHDCAQERVATMLPWPTWQVLPNGRIEPSISCETCGFHEFMPIEWTVYGREVVPSPRGSL